MNAPPLALEPGTRLGAPIGLERRLGGWVPSLSAALTVFLAAATVRSFIPVTAPLRKPKLTLLQQLRLEGG